MKKILSVLILAALLLTSCQNTSTEDSSSNIALEYSNPVKITLSDNGITCDDESVYTANDIIYYESGKDFTYGEGEKADEHEKEEADAHTVVHITKAGVYEISGKLSQGQIAVDLGDDAKKDETAVVTLVLNGVDITCTVAPGIIFYNVYECGDKDNPSMTVDTSKSGANIVIADDSTNTVNGAYVAKIYKSVELNEDGTEIIDSKKLHKYDGAVYSKKSMSIYGGEKGNGVLNINAENEGLDSELHLTINSGNININSGNDGINTNEDGVSVTTINGGNLNIVVNGSTGEGDGIDSNGWLVINGGNVIAQACGTSADSGIDSDMGIYLNGGAVVATGSMLDSIEGENSTYAVFNFSAKQGSNKTYTLKNKKNKTVWEFTSKNKFSNLIVFGNFLTEGTYTLWQGETQLQNSGKSTGGVGFGGGMGFGGGQKPQGNMPNFENGEMPEFDMSQFGNGQIPEFNGDMSNFPQGERPEFNGSMPEFDMSQFPNGEMPEFDMSQFPQGERPNGGQRPNGQGNGGNFQNSMSEPTKDFEITKGANNFIGVTTLVS